MPTSIEKVWNNDYLLLEQIGAGGMGEVWKAYHKRLGCVYAVKLLNTTLLSREKDHTRFRREISNLSSLNHENIVKFVEASEDPTEPGYAMEFCPKGNIEGLRSGCKGNYDTVHGILLQLSSAVSELHDCPSRIVHRDIKPQNVLIGLDGRFKLSDFGLSLALTTDEKDRVTTSIWVSQHFSPPEQHANMATVDEKGDLYSIGAVGFYLLTGTFAVPDQAVPPGLPGTASAGGADPENHLEAAFRGMLQRLLRKNPENRIQSAAEIQNGLQLMKTNGEILDCPKCGKWSLYRESGRFAQWERCSMCPYAREVWTDEK